MNSNIIRTYKGTSSSSSSAGGLFARDDWGGTLSLTEGTRAGILKGSILLRATTKVTRDKVSERYIRVGDLLILQCEITMIATV